MQNNELIETLRNWRPMLKKFQKPNNKKAIVQLLNSFLPFLGLWVLMYFSLNWSYLLTLGLAAIATFFLVRIFIIQHDCGHQSFLRSRKVNNFIGILSSIFSTIPYKYWSHTHNAHHAHNGQLEHRGLGDIHFLTTEEYHRRSRWGKLRYRIYRNSIVQFLIIPVIYLTVIIRYPFVSLKAWKKIRWNHVLNNLIIVAILGGVAILLGWQKFLLVHIPVLVFFGTVAFWFFYIQHQHEDNYKEWKDQWDHLLASIRGSTYYKLPKMFQWLSGNIGFHHIHHLNSRIPNYNLEACAAENPVINQFVPTLTFRQSLRCIHFKLWDENEQRMLSFGDYRKYQADKKRSGIMARPHQV